MKQELGIESKVRIRLKDVGNIHRSIQKALKSKGTERKNRISSQSLGKSNRVGGERERASMSMGIEVGT